MSRHALGWDIHRKFSKVSVHDVTDDGDLRVVERLDNSTESIRSPKDTETWQRKIRIYHALQDAQLAAGKRFRVLTITTRDSDRLDHILWLSSKMSPDKRRSLFLGSTLDNFLNSSDPIGQPCFHDHRENVQSLLQLRDKPVPATPQAEPLASVVGVC